MKRNRFSYLLGSFVVLFAGAIVSCGQSADVGAENEQPEGANVTAVKEEPTQNGAVEEVAVLETSAGTIVLKFYPDLAPGHVENFKKLAKSGFYDGTKFHRVIKGFMIQGGCPNTKNGSPSTWGTGDPGYKIKAEFNNKPHVKGSLSMARGNDPNSAGCQFFICHGRAEHLDKLYTNFGEVLKGLDVLDKIATAPVKPNPYMRNENSLPVEPVVLKKATIVPITEIEQ